MKERILGHSPWIGTDFRTLLASNLSYKIAVTRESAYEWVDQEFESSSEQFDLIVPTCNDQMG